MLCEPLTLTLRAVALALPLALASFPALGQEDPCTEFRQTITTTYNFKPSRLSEAEQNAESSDMDRFWKMVKAKPSALLPCLGAAVADSQSDAWFRFDGSNLLVSLDPSHTSKAEQVRQYTAVDLDDVHLQVWVTVIAQRGVEGFDVSEAGARWLAYPKAQYYLPEHGVFKVDKFLGSIFIFGSMDETQATPALLKIAAAAGHPGRENAISLLLMQATPEAIRGLKGIDSAGLSSSAHAVLREHLKRPRMITPRERPKTSRAQFLRAFNDAVKGNWQYFFDLVREVPDGEKDVVATLKAEDVPLVRKVRRKMITNANQHAAEYYVSFTEILSTLTWQPD